MYDLQDSASYIGTVNAAVGDQMTCIIEHFGHSSWYDSVCIYSHRFKSSMVRHTLKILITIGTVSNVVIAGNITNLPDDEPI